MKIELRPIVRPKGWRGWLCRVFGHKPRAEKMLLSWRTREPGKGWEMHQRDVTLDQCQRCKLILEGVSFNLTAGDALEGVNLHAVN